MVGCVQSCVAELVQNCGEKDPGAGEALELILRSLGDTSHRSLYHNMAALAAATSKCSVSAAERANLRSTPLQMVEFEGDVPVMALPAGRTRSIIVFWYQKHLFWRCGSRPYLFSCFIQYIYSIYMGNFVEIWLNWQMDFTRKSLSEVWSVWIWHFVA